MLLVGHRAGVVEVEEPARFRVAIRRSSNLPHILGRTTSRSKDGRRTLSRPLAAKTLK
jgi:hypothetical protein